MRDAALGAKRSNSWLLRAFATTRCARMAWQAPTNFNRFVFDDSEGQNHAFLLGERGLMLHWTAVS